MSDRWLWVVREASGLKLVMAVADHPDGFHVVRGSIAVEGTVAYTRWLAGTTDVQALLAPLARHGKATIRIIDVGDRSVDLSDTEALWEQATNYRNTVAA